MPEISPEQSGETQGTDLETARKILGQDCLGPEDVESAFDNQFSLSSEISPIPPIPFSPEQLEIAKTNSQFLIYREAKINGETSLTIQEMNGLLNGRLNDGDKILTSRGQSPDQEFYSAETPRRGWALVDKAIIPGTTGQDYLLQTESMIQHLQSVAFKDRELPEEYRRAVEEFEQQKEEIRSLLTNDWQEAAARLQNLQITQLLRPNAAENLYDSIVYFQKSGQRIRKVGFTWTSSRSSFGSFVRMGDWIQNFGIDVLNAQPNEPLTNLSAALSRRS